MTGERLLGVGLGDKLLLHPLSALVRCLVPRDCDPRGVERRGLKRSRGVLGLVDLTALAHQMRVLRCHLQNRRG